VCNAYIDEGGDGEIREHQARRAPQGLEQSTFRMSQVLSHFFERGCSKPPPVQSHTYVLEPLSLHTSPQ
jgi:hypothetical protein